LYSNQLFNVRNEPPQVYRGVVADADAVERSNFVTSRTYSTLEQKIVWLLKHRKFLVGKVNKKVIVTAMKYDKLVALSTYWPDVRIDEALRQAKARWFAEHNH
jgi:hypothetical protein